MLITLIFGILGVVLLVGGLQAPHAQRNPSIRVGLWFVGAAALLVALVVLLGAL